MVHLKLAYCFKRWRQVQRQYLSYHIEGCFTFLWITLGIRSKNVSGFWCWENSIPNCEAFFFTAFFSTEAYLDSHRADFKSSNNRPSQAEETKRNYICQVSTKSCLGNDLQVHEEMTLHLTMYVLYENSYICVSQK